MREKVPTLVTGEVLEEGDSRLEGFDLHLPKSILGPDLEEVVAKAMVLDDSRV